MDKPSMTTFMRFSFDFLALLQSKSKRAEINKTIADEVSVLEWFYKEVESLLKNYDLHIQELSLLLCNERVKSKLLEKELQSIMSAALSRDEVGVKLAVENSKFDTSKLESGNLVKYRFREPLSKDKFESVKRKFLSGTPLSTIISHYVLSEDQLIKLVDNTK